MRKIILGVCILAITSLAGACPAYAQNPLAELQKADEQRMKAISDGDLAAVGALLADDYVHVHNTGEVNNKSQYLAFLQTHPRRAPARRTRRRHHPRLRRCGRDGWPLRSTMRIPRILLRLP